MVMISRFAEFLLDLKLALFAQKTVLSVNVNLNIDVLPAVIEDEQKDTDTGACLVRASVCLTWGR